ncbi:hypothetical protein C900_05935 [Fulvivirga imtechensis AK7]|uniref:Uncharacterized protein n=1 Tax=Fulvivirga imtechensis AK7 TaxID=1237149 RepID=L8JMQ1_9BACT|nr:hypothetical protein C900_05935 [Fulvivirga imtechensis AK7]
MHLWKNLSHQIVSLFEFGCPFDGRLLKESAQPPQIQHKKEAKRELMVSKF